VRSLPPDRDDDLQTRVQPCKREFGEADLANGFANNPTFYQISAHSAAPPWRHPPVGAVGFGGPRPPKPYEITRTRAPVAAFSSVTVLLPRFVTHTSVPSVATAEGLSKS
jgi:hypothetical protein